MIARSRGDIPVVFVSSTSEDLQAYRAAARDAALKANFHPEMMESFTVSGARRPLAECQARAAQADVTVVIVAHRYGWVPADQPGDEHKNICWLECDAAIAAGQELLAFIVDDRHPWSEELREEKQLMQAVRDGRATPEQLVSVQRSIVRLRDFKAWLNARGIRALFTTPEDLRGSISDALREWRSRHADIDRAAPTRRAPEEDDGFALQRLIVEEHARRFVGRSSIQQAFDRFVAGAGRGYFIVRSEPGQGKTALLSHLVMDRDWPHHLIRRGTGRSDARLIVGSLIGQLAAREGTPADLPETLPDRVRRLENQIAASVEAARPLVVAIDALDELPDDAGRELPFLVTEGLPAGAFYFVTSRPGARVDALLASLKQFGVPFELHALGPLSDDESRSLLRARDERLSGTDVERIAAAADGSPLYLTSILETLARDPRFDLRTLPPAVEGIFEQALALLRRDDGALARQVLSLLLVARKPLSLAELCGITRRRQREVDDGAIRPVRQFLTEWNGAFGFYHARFGEFLRERMIYPDEVADAHRQMADWLLGSGRSSEYRRTSLAHHLYAAGDVERLTAEINPEFLRAKTDRFGYDVLEDVECLSRAMLDADDPRMVSRCATIVEDLRQHVGGDLIRETRRAVQGLGAAPDVRRPVPWDIPPVPGLDAFGMLLPKLGVGADFIEAVPRDGRLLVALGDAPGVGLRGAFVARFVANLFRRLALGERRMTLAQILQEIDRRIGSHEFFERVTMQCVEVDPAGGTIAVANAGVPHPVLFSARRGKSDRVIVRGTCLHDGLDESSGPPRFEQRRVEFEPGDVFVMATDGLTEGHRLTDDRYGHRHQAVVERATDRGAQPLAEAIFADWTAHPRDESYFDDVSIVVIAARRDDTSPMPAKG